MIRMGRKVDDLSKATSKSKPAPAASSPAARAVMQGNRRRDTRPELAVRRALHARGLRYFVDRPVVVGGVRVRPDVVFPRRRLALFIDGCFWHGCPAHGTSPRVNAGYWGKKIKRNQERDARVGAALTAAGWRVVRAWEHQSPDEVATLVAATFAISEGPQT